MARRRRIKQAFGATFDTAADILALLASQSFALKKQEEQNKLIAKRQAELEEQRRKGERENKVFDAALSQVQQGQGFASDLGFPELSPFEPSPSERLGKLGEGIEGATTRADIPTLPGLVGQAEAAGVETVGPGLPIEQLIRAREEKERTLRGLEPRERVESIGPEGITTAQFLTEEEQGGLGAIPTERTAEQEAERAKQISLGSEFSPEITSAKARQAGAVSGAEAAASEAAKTRVRFELLPQLVKIEEALALARASGRPNKQANEGAIAAGKRLIELANRVNTQETGPAALIQGGKQRLGALFQLESFDDRFELDNMRAGYTPLFARLIGHTGVLTEKDEERTQKILPQGGLKVELNNRVNANFQRALSKAAKLGDLLGPIDSSLSPEEQSAEYNRRLDSVFSESGDLNFTVDENGNLVPEF